MQEATETERLTVPEADAASSSAIPDVSFLGPDRVLDAAYALYVVDSAPAEERHQEIYRMAQQIIDDFRRLYEGLEYGSADWIFMFSVQQIMVSLAKGIGRRKRELEEHLRAAREKRDRRLKIISNNTMNMGLLKACWRVLLWGGMGYFLTHSLLSKTSAEATHNSQTLMSLAAAIACVLVGSFIRARVTSAQYSLIFNSFESDQLRAQTNYNKGALEEYKRAKRDAARAWEHLTHKKPTEWLAFDAVLAEDLAHSQSLSEREDRYSGTLARVMSPVGHWVNKYMIVLRRRRPRRTSLPERVQPSAESINEGK